METPLTFKNRNGCTLFGMLYEPDSAACRGVGVVICVNAVKYRLGTFRLHVLLARQLRELGYTVLSFDPEGIGDSEGDFQCKLLSEHYYDIQTGKYSGDLADAVAFFRGRCTLDSLLLFGLCGGAISVLIEAATDPRVDGLILLNIPVLVEDLRRKGVENSAAKITSSERAASLLSDKAARLVDWRFWKRLVTLQVDYREEAGLVGKAVSVLMRKMLSKLLPSRKTPGADMPVSTNSLFNMHFQSAFIKAAEERKKMLLVFAELDPWTWIFKSEFQDVALKPGSALARHCTVERIAAANHIFSGRHSQSELGRRIVGWLTANYPGRSAQLAAS